MVKYRDLVQVADLFNVLENGECALSGHIANNPEIDRDVAQSAVFILHDENGLSGTRNILAVFSVFGRSRQVDFKMRPVIADSDDAQIVLRRNTAMGN